MNEWNKKRDKFNYNNNHHTWNRISKSKPVGVSSTTKNGKKFHLDFFFIFLVMKKIYVNIRISWNSIRNDFDKNLSHTFLWWLAIFLDFFFLNEMNKNDEKNSPWQSSILIDRSDVFKQLHIICQLLNISVVVYI